jgi:hypothetical protein
MFWRRKDARAEDGVSASRIAPDRAVRTAERFVRRAWAHELARRRDRQEFALHIERENCDTAFELFIAAQRDGDPEQISAARTMALEAVDAVRVAVTARDQARRTLRKEGRMLTRDPMALSLAADAGGHPRSRPSKPIVKSQGRRGLHLRRLVRWRAADLGQQ